MASDRFTEWLWLGGAIALFMFGQSALLGSKRSGRKVYKLPARFPEEWDGRIVALQVGRAYRLPVPTTDEDAYWKLQFREGSETQSYFEKFGIAPTPVGWEAEDGQVFTWIEPTEDMAQITLELQLWGNDGLLKAYHSVKLVKR